MHLAAIKIFCDVVRQKSFSRAAGANKLSQSAVSQSVSQLEKNLGVRLIDRSHRPFQLTPEGRLYYQGCRGLVERYYAIEAEVRNLQGELAGTVRASAIYSVGLGRMSDYVRRFCQRYPQARVRMSYLHPDEVYQTVAADDADIGLVSYPQARRGLAVIDWRSERLVVACSPTHPLAGRTRLTARDLDGQPFIAFAEGLRIGREIDTELRRCGCEVDAVMAFDNIETIKRALELGEAVSILPEPMVTAEVQLGALAVVPLVSPRMHRPLGIVYRRSAVWSRVVQEFVNLIRRDGAGDRLDETHRTVQAEPHAGAGGGWVSPEVAHAVSRSSDEDVPVGVGDGRPDAGRMQKVTV
ncbi:MAG: LysR family transcriptional regulator [Planctomycetes bacterium]|nr:LysR family transcriptional regulator [Planctomycetota bacterium]